MIDINNINDWKNMKHGISSNHLKPFEFRRGGENLEVVTIISMIIENYKQSALCLKSVEALGKTKVCLELPTCMIEILLLNLILTFSTNYKKSIREQGGNFVWDRILGR